MSAEMNEFEHSLIAQRDQAVNDLECMRRAVMRYADTQPLDLKSLGKIQRELRAIAGNAHYHVNSIGSDECLVCGHDLRHKIHSRAAAVSDDRSEAQVARMIETEEAPKGRVP